MLVLCIGIREDRKNGRELVCVVRLNVCCRSRRSIVSNELSDIHSVSLCSAEQHNQVSFVNGTL